MTNAGGGTTTDLTIYSPGWHGPGKDGWAKVWVGPEPPPKPWEAGWLWLRKYIIPNKGPCASPDAPAESPAYQLDVWTGCEWVVAVCCPQQWFIGPEPPCDPVEGLLWFDTRSKQLVVYACGDWVATSCCVQGFALGPEPPDNPYAGQPWFDGETLRIWDCREWRTAIQVPEVPPPVSLGKFPDCPRPGDLHFKAGRIFLRLECTWLQICCPDIRIPVGQPPRDAPIGTPWFDERTLYIKTARGWVPTSGSDSRPAIVVSCYRPECPFPGLLWWTGRSLFVYGDCEFIQVCGASLVCFSETAPDPVRGLPWFDGRTLCIGDGERFVPVVGPGAPNPEMAPGTIMGNPGPDAGPGQSLDMDQVAVLIGTFPAAQPGLVPSNENAPLGAYFDSNGDWTVPGGGGSGTLPQVPDKTLIGNVSGETAIPGPLTVDQVWALLFAQVLVTTAAYTVTDEMTINVNVASPVTITLPAASTRSGKWLRIKDVSGNAGTNNIMFNIPDFLEGSTGIFDNYGSVILVPINDGTTIGWGLL